MCAKERNLRCTERQNSLKQNERRTELKWTKIRHACRHVVFHFNLLHLHRREHTCMVTTVCRGFLMPPSSLKISPSQKLLYPVYTKKHAWSTHETHVFNIHMHDVCSNRVFTWSSKHRANIELAQAALLEPRPLAQM